MGTGKNALCIATALLLLLFSGGKESGAQEPNRRALYNDYVRAHNAFDEAFVEYAQTLIALPNAISPYSPDYPERMRKEWNRRRLDQKWEQYKQARDRLWRK